MYQGTSWAKQCRTVKKIKPAALAVIKLRQSEGIGQADSQQKIF